MLNEENVFKTLGVFSDVYRTGNHRNLITKLWKVSNQLNMKENFMNRYLNSQKIQN